MLYYFFPPLERADNSKEYILPILSDAKVWLSLRNPDFPLSCILLDGIPPNFSPSISLSCLIWNYNVNKFSKDLNRRLIYN